MVYTKYKKCVGEGGGVTGNNEPSYSDLKSKKLSLPAFLVIVCRVTFLVNSLVLQILYIILL